MSRVCLYGADGSYTCRDAAAPRRAGSDDSSGAARYRAIVAAVGGHPEGFSPFGAGWDSPSNYVAPEKAESDAERAAAEIMMKSQENDEEATDRVIAKTDEAIEEEIKHARRVAEDAAAIAGNSKNAMTGQITDQKAWFGKQSVADDNLGTLSYTVLT